MRPFGSVVLFVALAIANRAPECASTAARPSGGDPRGPLAWHEDLDYARREAARTGKPVLLYFDADWNAASFFHERTFTDPRLALYVRARYVTAYVDVTEAEGPRIDAATARFRVVGTPTLLVLAPDMRTELARVNEIVPPQALARVLERAELSLRARDFRADGEQDERAVRGYLPGARFPQE